MATTSHIATSVLVFLVTLESIGCMLFPRESESREVKDISGLWNFRADNSSDRNAGFKNQWWQKPLRQVSYLLFNKRFIDLC